MSKPNITTNDRIVANGYTSKNSGVGIDCNMISNDGVPGHINRSPIVVNLKILCTQCNTLIYGDMMPEYTRLSYHHTCPVVNGEIFANGGARVDVDACGRMGHLGDDSRQYGYVHHM